MGRKEKQALGERKSKEQTAHDDGRNILVSKQCKSPIRKRQEGEEILEGRKDSHAKNKPQKNLKEGGDKLGMGLGVRQMGQKI